MKYNLTGKTFSFLTVIEDDGTRSSNGSIKWKCKCVCGNITHVSATLLMKNKIKSCGCKLKELNHIAHLNNLTGKRFGRLIAIKYVDKDKNSNALWLCKCDCGNEKIINSVALLNGNCKSCGCLLKENRIDLTNKKFGKLTALYPVENKTELKWHCRC